jgi:hypothetical protein
MPSEVRNAAGLDLSEHEGGHDAVVRARGSSQPGDVGCDLGPDRVVADPSQRNGDRHLYFRVGIL